MLASAKLPLPKDHPRGLPRMVDRSRAACVVRLMRRSELNQAADSTEHAVALFAVAERNLHGLPK